MQNTRKNHPRKGSKLMDVKLFIVALALATTIGLWNLLSNAAVQADKAPAAQQAPPPTQPETTNGQDLPPLPTLVSLAPVATLQPAAASDQVNVSDQSQTAALRVVGIPTQVIVQKASPIINQPVVSGGGGHGGGGKNSPVTSTRSSH